MQRSWRGRPCCAQASSSGGAPAPRCIILTVLSVGTGPIPAGFFLPNPSPRTTTMCGICVSVHDNGPADAVALRTMLDRIVHRGPDSEGMEVDGGVGLGMRRLSIIDLAGGHQPIYNEDRTLAVVFNGEIYNYR